jgi:hypothetical protein
MELLFFLALAFAVLVVSAALDERERTRPRRESRRRNQARPWR